MQLQHKSISPLCPNSQQTSSLIYIEILQPWLSYQPLKMETVQWTCPGSHCQEMPKPKFFSSLCIAQLLRYKADELLAEPDCEVKAHSAMRGFGAETCREIPTAFLLSHYSRCQGTLLKGSTEAEPAAKVQGTEAGLLPLWSRIRLTGFKMWASHPCSNRPFLTQNPAVRR